MSGLMDSTAPGRTISTRVPARLDRLPWAGFHWRVVIGLGTVWLLDGLEVTMVGSVAARLTDPGSGIDIGPGGIGLAAAIYIVGACTGALVFGQLTDRFGRRRLFIITLVVYIAATVATAFAFAPWYFYLARFVTGAGIGGEYAAVNSAIDELIPARARGRVDLVINGTYWAGAAAGAAMALFLLNESIFATDLGWRLAFGFGAVLGLVIMVVRRHVPESPRWMFIHGHADQAEQLVDRIERAVVEESGTPLAEPESEITVRQRKAIPFRTIAHTAFRRYPRRAVLGLALFIGQAFAYNGVTFNLGTLLSTFYGVASGVVPLLIILWALSNFAGPVTLGRLFDTIGRKPMISGTFGVAAALLLVLTVVFAADLGLFWFMVVLIATFFFASAGASSAYLTVSEIFPMETRALAIAFFYAVGTAAGGIVGPLLFGSLIATGERGAMSVAFVVSAVVLGIAALAELTLGVRAEQASLERLAKPLTAEGPAGTGEAAGAGAGEPESEAGRLRRAAQRRRDEAAELRARSAEHRANSLELRLAADQDPATRERMEVEEGLANLADLRALRLAELAAADDERAAAAEESSDHAAAAARERAEAAHRRAEALHEREQALTAAEQADAARAHELSQAAGEQARARERRALAEQALAGAETESGAAAELRRAEAAAHERWSRVHQARARVHLARSRRDDSAADREDQQAAEAEQLARAAEQRAVAAEQREQIQTEPKALRVGGAQPRVENGRAEVERQVRQRLARRLERERAGLRRLRPGPGTTLLSGRFGGLDPEAVARSEEALEREVDVIARALTEQGTMDRRDLAQRVGARYWGPGRFSAALRLAVEEGVARRVSRRTYAPVE